MNSFSRLASGALAGASCVIDALAQERMHSYDPSALRTNAQVVADLGVPVCADRRGDDRPHYRRSDLRSSRAASWIPAVIHVNVLADKYA
jgi:hypothetical protein